jgi:preprotein translocase subunit SecY
MFRKIASTFANCFKIPELKSRIIYTLIVLAICRVVSMIPIPGINGGQLQAVLRRENPRAAGGGSWACTACSPGGALERCAIGALGIMPYISATIIIQLSARSFRA